MEDAEVARQALGICLSSWSQLEAKAKNEKVSEAEIVKAYVEVCPFVHSASPAFKAALELLEKVPKGWWWWRRAAKVNTTSEEQTAEATRVAMRISISMWSGLMAQRKTLDDFELMKLYIQLCPYVPTTSDVADFVLKGLKQASSQIPPPLSNVESDSDDSLQINSTNDTPSDIGGEEFSVDNEPKMKKRFNRRLFFVRTFLLDFPMAILFATYLGLNWVERVDELFIVPAMEAAEWTEERAENEITYYNRQCDDSDITAKTPDELLVPEDATIREAYEHQLKHGFSIFQNVLTEYAMNDLRAFVNSRNRKLSAEESIFVIEGQNRFSFGLGTEEPSVAKAVKHLATHEKLAPALEMILGPNPALIEMTAITACYGAISQYWHDDVIAPASAMKYGRTFGPSYSVFIQLQNTTKGMGATSTCPGSHKCSSGATGEMEEICERQGFQFVDSRTGYWKAGDALLMNMNSYHRGSAHTDPYAEDRVMLILTFVPQPERTAESRQLSQGITFSLRWDMWGHTLWDLREADTRMKQPWATLRALGLYKFPGAVWGVDYVSSATMRMANKDNGFRRDELEKFVEERGGFEFLPRFLQGRIRPDDNWHDFLTETLEKCSKFLGFLNFFVFSLFASSSVVLLGVMPDQYGTRGFWTSILRSAIAYGSVFMMWRAANRHVDSTDWAKDIRAGRKYSVDFGAEGLLSQSLQRLPSTLPHQKDVLIETRYGSRHFHMYNDFTNDHPGSRIFQEFVRDYANAYDQVKSEMFRDSTAAYVVSLLHQQQGRFLFQQGNEWRWLTGKKEIDYAKSELAVASNQFLGNIRRTIRFLESEYKYGSNRKTALALKSLKDLKHLKKRLLQDTPSGSVIFTAAEEESPNDLAFAPEALDVNFVRLRQRLMIPSSMRPLANPIRRRRNVNIAPKPNEPRRGSWLKSGDVVEGTEFLDNGEAHWYTGVLEKVTASGDYFIAYYDKSFGIVGGDSVRPYEPYQVDEEVEVFMGEDEVALCTVVADNGDWTWDVFIEDEDTLVKQVPLGDLRRLNEDEMKEERQVRNKYA